MTEPRADLRTAVRMLGFAWAADRRRAVLTFVLLTGEALAGSLFALWLGLFVDAVARHRHPAAVLAGLAIALSVTATAVLDYAGSRVRMALRERTQHLLDRRLLELVGRTPTLSIQETPDHLRQLELLQSESWQFGEAVPSVINAVTTAVRVAVAIALLASISPLLLLLPAFGLPTVALSRSTGDLFNTGNERAAEPARRAGMLFDLALDRGAAKELRVFGLRGQLRARFTAEHETIRSIHVGLAVRAQLLRLATRLVFTVGYVAAIVLVTRLAAHGQASVGDVVRAAVVAGQVLTLVVGSAELAQWLHRTLTAAARYLYLERVSEPPAGGVAPPQRLERGITLDRVGYRYPGRRASTLVEFSAHLPAGATVAVVGDNGAGKTTLVKLLAGLCRPDTGAIRIDGVDLAALDTENWRGRVSAGLQDHARFEFTVGRTVGLGQLDRLDDTAAVRAALDRAGAAELPDQLPAGLATQLGPAWPDGVDLSGGQWQRLAIGRAMMRTDPLLLLLDEPTAAIDAETEHRLFTRWTRAAAAARRRSGAITVLVSHRLSTVRRADLILVLCDGRIVESGRHDELVAAGGLYAELFELQSRAYR